MVNIIVAGATGWIGREMIAEDMMLARQLNPMSQGLYLLRER